MARSTVPHGRKQLMSGEFEKDRIRKPGGGRKSIEKNSRNFDSGPRYLGFRDCRGSDVGEIMVSEYDRKCCLSIELTWISDLGSLRQLITEAHGLFASGES